MMKSSRLLSTVIFATTLLGGSAALVPAFAQDDMSTSTTSTTSTTTTSASAGSSAMAQKMEAHVETRIKTLHDELKITPDQEQQWNNVAQTMRSNEATMEPLYEARKNTSTMSAIDNLKSHQAMSQAYADSFNKFIAAFEPLYNSMSADQKKWADESFSKEAVSHDHMKTMTSKKTSHTTTTTGTGQ
jgi:Spy/CpxP family protein refolding chaperone